MALSDPQVITQSSAVAHVLSVASYLSDLQLSCLPTIVGNPFVYSAYRDRGIEHSY